MITGYRPLPGMALACAYLTVFALLTYPLRLLNILPSETAWGERASAILDEEGL